MVSNTNFCIYGHTHMTDKGTHTHINTYKQINIRSILNKGTTTAELGMVSYSCKFQHTGGGRPRQENTDFGRNLGYIVSFRSARSTV